MLKSLVIILVSGAVFCQVHGQQYLWPLKLEPQLSSRFGDWRAGHWHAGIDIRTQGRTGFKVLAIDNGFIFKVRTSFWGYGKSLYLRLADGKMAVYGHLESFTNAIDEFVRNKQLQQKNYFQDLIFETNQFPVKKGDIIAMSGQSGVGYPHLHLEIRDKNNIPINPLVYAYKITDKQAPIVRHLAIKRYIDYGLYNYHDLEFMDIKGTNPNYYVPETIAIYNQNVFAISAYDQGADFDFGIYKAQLFIDDKEIFAFEHDSLNYITGAQISYVNDSELSSLFGGSGGSDENAFYRLYIQKDDVQTFYGIYRYPAGIINADDFSNGVHQAKIELYDVNGNKCQVRMFLKKANLSNPVYQDLSASSNRLIFDIKESRREAHFQIQSRQILISPYIDAKSQFDLKQRRLNFPKIPGCENYRIRAIESSGDFSPWREFSLTGTKSQAIAFADYLNTNYSLAENIAINGKSTQPIDSTRFPRGDNRWQALLEVPAKDGRLIVSSDKSGALLDAYRYESGGIAFSPDSTIMITFSDKNLYDPIVISLTNIHRDKDGNYLFEIYPHDLIFNDTAQLSLTLDKLKIDSIHTSLYLSSETGKNVLNKGQIKRLRFTGPISAGGRYALIADTRPPVIAGLKPTDGRSTRNLRPLISCLISDNLSGFSKETQFEMTIDGQWVPADFDITTGNYGYQVNQPLKLGSHIIHIKAIDNQGNVANQTTKFTILGKY